MNKRAIGIFVVSALLLSLPLYSCTKKQTAIATAESVSFAGNFPETQPGRETGIETVSGQDKDMGEQGLLDPWLGHYAHAGWSPEDGHIGMELFIYKENGIYYGYLNMDGYELEEDGSFFEARERILTEIRGDQDTVGIYYLERFSEEGQRGRMYGSYQKGDLLCTLNQGESGLVTVWEGLSLEEREKDRERGFVKMELLSLQLVNQRDRETFLSANGIPANARPFYQYWDEDRALRLEIYYDFALKNGVGIFYNQLQEPDIMCGFLVGELEPGIWEDDKFSVDIRGGASLGLENYKETITYNDLEKPEYFCSEGIVTSTKEPYLGNIVEINFTYREDGTLQKKDCHYNSWVFGTTRQSEYLLFDGQERLVYTDAYITHGYLEDYYIYEGGKNKPSYCLTLDHMGTDAYAARFVQFTAEKQAGLNDRSGNTVKNAGQGTWEESKPPYDLWSVNMDEPYRQFLYGKRNGANPYNQEEALSFYQEEAYWETGEPIFPKEALNKYFALADVNGDGREELIFRIAGGSDELLCIFGCEGENLIALDVYETHTPHISFSIGDNNIVRWGQNHTGEEEIYYGYDGNGRPLELIHFISTQEWVETVAFETGYYYEYYYLDGQEEQKIYLHSGKEYQDAALSYQGNELDWYDLADFSDVQVVR